MSDDLGHELQRVIDAAVERTLNQKLPDLVKAQIEQHMSGLVTTNIALGEIPEAKPHIDALSAIVRKRMAAGQ